MRSRAFTLIELLVVIAIIGLLSSIVLASLNSARQKAQYAAVASELQEAYKAFYLLNIERGCWPRENSSACNGYSASGNPTIAALIADPSFGLSKYLSAAPSWPFSSSKWSYDNDGDARSASACANGIYSPGGVMIFVPHATEEQYEALDKIFDGDADPDTNTARSCGRIIYDSTNIYGTQSIAFYLSETQ
jgi:prepilin-type N-terminal cleavage/methylation domain-containing protein